MTLENRQEREHGRALERPGEMGRQRPRLGGTTPLPELGSSTDLFLASLEDLTTAERAAPAWCVRVGVPSTVHEMDNYNNTLPELLVELTVTVAGVAYALEFNAHPGATLAVVGEQVAAKVKWSADAATAPAAGSALTWHVSRGWCESNAVRAFKVQGGGDARSVPAFATGFALFTGQESAIAENIQLNFFSALTSYVAIHHYTKEDLLQTFGAFTPVPPLCGAWRWQGELAVPLRLVFRLGVTL